MLISQQHGRSDRKMDAHLVTISCSGNIEKKTSKERLRSELGFAIHFSSFDVGTSVTNLRRFRNESADYGCPANRQSHGGDGIIS
jgi:hypothetical protein